MIDVRELIYQAVGPWGQAVVLITVLLVIACSVHTTRPGTDR